MTGRLRLSPKTIPPVQTGLVRERLLTLANSRLGLVLAPAGYGKTRLLAQAADVFPGPVCWYRADPADRQPAQLLAKLGGALHRSVDTRAGAASWEQIAASLETASAQRALLVIDDFHELEGSDSERHLAGLIESGPPSLRVLIAGRRWPALDIDELRMSGESTVIEAADLQFRPWEVERLFREVYGEPLRPEDAAALTRRTGGWAAGLAMFRLLTARRSPAERSQALSELSGGSRLVRSYLVREVLEELQPEIRDFLRRTSALHVFTAETCDALLHRADSRHVIDDLERRQFFIGTDDGLRYRYHQVLQDHLELELLEELGAPAAQDWYGQAAGVLEAAGEVSGAFRAYVRAEYWAAMQRLLHARGAEVVARPLDPVAERLPVSLSSEDPWLVLAEARRLTRHGALTRAVTAYRKAESLTTDLDVAARWRAERRQVSQWLSRGEVVAGNWPGLVRIATRRTPGQIARSAASHRDPEARIVAALANLLAGALDEADSMLQDAMHDAGAGQRVVDIAVYAHAVIRLLLADRAAVDRSELEAVVLEAEVADHPWWARLGFALMEAVEGHFATLELARAQADREEDLWGSGLILLLHGIAAHAPGPLDTAAAVFDHLDAPVLRLWARCLVAVLPDKDRLHRVRQARSACKALDVCAVLPAAQRWAAQPAAPLLREQPAAAQLRVLGGFRLTIGGVEIDQAAVRPRARMALHLLAVHAGRPVHRDALVQAIWPESQGDAGHRNTHVAISSLRHLLEPEAKRGQSVLLPRLGDSYSLVLPGGSRCDIDDFEAALSRARTARIAGDLAAERASLHRALSCYGGELLPEDGLAEWVVTERERLRLAAADASERLARAEAGAGDIGTAIEYARRTLALDCYRDTAWRLLVQLHERAGDASAAHAVRREHQKMLAELELT